MATTNSSIVNKPDKLSNQTVTASKHDQTHVVAFFFTQHSNCPPGLGHGIEAFQLNFFEGHHRQSLPET